MIPYWPTGMVKIIISLYMLLAGRAVLAKFSFLLLKHYSYFYLKPQSC